MRKAAIILLCIVVLLGGCYRKGSVGKAKAFDAAHIADACIPFCGTPDYAFDSIALLDTDSYGRKLFYYESWRWETTALLICQKAENSYAYYYPDYAYIIEKGSDHVFSDAEINWLKSENDWEKPLETERMYSVNFVYEENRFDYMAIEKAIRSTLCKENTEVPMLLDGLEYDKNGNQIILTIVGNRYTQDADYEIYLALIQPTDEVSIVAIQQIENDADIRECLIDFKEAFCTF